MITSQRELVQVFGNPKFYVNQGTPLHGYELNEYGLLAAYQYLGIANRAYIMRGDLDMAQLEPSLYAPRGPALSGTYWLDTSLSSWGAFVSNGNAVPGRAWRLNSPVVIDTQRETETVILGDQGYTDNTTDVITTAGTWVIDIDGTTVTWTHSGVSGDDVTLQDIVDDINNQAIPNIRAVAFRYSGLSYFQLKNTSGESISIGNSSSPALLALLGITSPATQIVQPKSSLGQEGDLAIVTLNFDNIIFQKLTALDRVGQNDPDATVYWYMVGHDSWKAATPTYSAGSTTPTLPLTIGDELEIGDGINTITVTMGDNFGVSTIDDIVDEINLAISNEPSLTRPTIEAAKVGSRIYISNWKGTDLELDEPVTNSTLGVRLALGVASVKGNELFYTPHYDVPANSVSGDVWIKTTEPRDGANYIVKLYSRFTSTWSVLDAPFYANDDRASISMGTQIAAGALYTQYNVYGNDAEPIASHFIKRYRGPIDLEVLGTKVPGENSVPFLVPGDKFVITASYTDTLGLQTEAYAVTIPGTEVDDVVGAVNALNIPGVRAYNSNGYLRIVNSNRLTCSFGYVDPNLVLDYSSTNTLDPLDQLGIQATTYSLWELLEYEQGTTAPTTDPDEGTLWYNVDFRVDIMVNDLNVGNTWRGYRNVYPTTDPAGAILAGSPPLTQSDGTPLVENDLWIDTSDTENYPRIFRYRELLMEWESIDTTDQTTPFGMLFADARWNNNGQLEGSLVIGDMLVSNYVDPDCPDPRLYPAGMLLFNTRYSNCNVKEWLPNYLEEYVGQELDDAPGEQYRVGAATFDVDTIVRANMGRWVTASGNQVDGSPWMLRKAQRIMIVRSLASAVVANQDIRSEWTFFNLIAAPGYPELIDELVTLNTDKKEIAFIVADTPARLKANATDIQNWATNANNAPSNGDLGLTTRNTYVGLWYPWGLSTNLDGIECMIPPSAIALRTIAYNDAVAYPWFAPAGFNRGMVTNAASVGYLSDEEEYVPTILNPGQRDVLYLNSINPIAFLPNRGLVVFGQKSLHPVSSALDRINVVRLINYMRYNLDIIAKPFLFEPNDKQTRDQVKDTFDRWMQNLIGLRALYDFAVVCDESNNTPTRIDRNELWIDIAIQPVKAIEFIYIPIRIRNTGEDLSMFQPPTS